MMAQLIGTLVQFSIANRLLTTHHRHCIRFTFRLPRKHLRQPLTHAVVYCRSIPAFDELPPFGCRQHGHSPHRHFRTLTHRFQDLHQRPAPALHCRRFQLTVVQLHSQPTLTAHTTQPQSRTLQICLQPLQLPLALSIHSDRRFFFILEGDRSRSFLLIAVVLLTRSRRSYCLISRTQQFVNTEALVHYAIADRQILTEKSKRVVQISESSSIESCKDSQVTASAQPLQQHLPAPQQQHIQTHLLRCRSR